MPLTGNPPEYTRGYDYEQHSIDQPNVPQPGDKLNQDFDDIATAVNATNGALQDILNPDGTLKDGIVGEEQLEPGFYDQLIDDASDDLQPFVDAAQTAATTATAAATEANASAYAADQSAQDAAGAVTTANDTIIQARAFAGQAQDRAAAADASADAAANSASTAQAHMVNAEDWSDLSFKWAEYLAGPVEPAPPGWPEAIDDGLWSSKWWALRARELVGAWGGLYLGAFPAPPQNQTGNAWPPGTIYYDTTIGQLQVWNGQQWAPITAPAPAVSGSFIYVAAADQTTFSGPDMAGNTPTIDPTYPEPSDVHVNGVRIVNAQYGPATADYSVDNLTSTLTINVPLTAGSIVQWDLFIPAARIAPGSVVAFKLLDVDRDPDTNESGEFDGVTTTFPMRYVNPASGQTEPATPTDGVQLMVSLDGVLQEFGVDFSTQGSDLVFTEAPYAGTRFWAVWYQPGLPSQ